MNRRNRSDPFEEAYVPIREKYSRSPSASGVYSSVKSSGNRTHFRAVRFMYFLQLLSAYPEHTITVSAIPHSRAFSMHPAACL